MSPVLLRRERIGPHLKVTLDDARRQNALSAEMVAEIDRALEDSVGQDRSSFVIAGANGVFSAGADLKSVSEALSHSPLAGEANPLQASNRAGGQFFARLNAHPMVTVAVVDGPAFGGGMGLACCADVVIATVHARFALSETSLGLPPAQITPYVVARIGLRHARRLALTGARLDGKEAAAIGLADFYCESDAERDAQLENLLGQIARCAPGANAVTKRLILACGHSSPQDYIEEAARSFAECLRGPEGREGVAAFLEKRPANWIGRTS